MPLVSSGILTPEMVCYILVSFSRPAGHGSRITNNAKKKVSETKVGSHVVRFKIDAKNQPEGNTVNSFQYTIVVL